MPTEQLKTTLTELHDELSDGGPVDEQTRELLKQLSDDINLYLKQTAEPDEASETGPVAKESVLDQLLDLTEEFEDSHPRLAEVIGRIATSLSRIGI